MAGEVQLRQGFVLFAGPMATTSVVTKVLLRVISEHTDKSTQACLVYGSRDPYRVPETCTAASSRPPSALCSTGETTPEVPESELRPGVWGFDAFRICAVVA